ncbi:hypothetical protein Ddc_19120 [Ditylenchus destructor]|nr:hypothetical protein Ddc_19120 [Ditylenchus destructor]
MRRKRCAPVKAGAGRPAGGPPWWVIASESAIGQLGRIQHLLERGAVDLGHLRGDVEDGPLLRIGALGDRGGLEVADLAVQRGDEDGLRASACCSPSTLTLKSRMACSASALDAEASSARLSSRLVAISGSITLSWKLPDWPATVIAASCPMTWAQTMVTASGITGLTLPGMMDEPGCSACSSISASPPADRSSSSAGRWRSHQRHRHALERARQRHRRVLRRQRGEEVRRRTEAQAGEGGQLLAEAAREVRMRVDAGAHRGAALRELAHRRQQRTQLRAPRVHLRQPAAQFLTQAQRHRVIRWGLREQVQRGQQLALQRLRGADVQHRGNGVIAALARVDVVVGLTVTAFEPPASRRVASVASTSLAFMLLLVPEPVWKTSTEEVRHQLRVLQQLCRGPVDGLADVDRQLLQADVGAGRGGLLLDQRAHETLRHGRAADGEVVDRALGLGAVEGVDGHGGRRPWSRVRCGWPWSSEILLGCVHAGQVGGSVAVGSLTCLARSGRPRA